MPPKRGVKESSKRKQQVIESDSDNEPRQATKQKLQNQETNSEDDDIVTQEELHDFIADEERGWTPIKDLTKLSRTWVIRAVVTRQGHIEDYIKDGKKGIRRSIILLDEEGTAIQATMFNEHAERLEEFFIKGETYYVTNGCAQPIEKKYVNANKEIELKFFEQTMVEVSAKKIMIDTIPYESVLFAAIKKNPAAFKKMDVFGTITNVKRNIRVIKQTTGLPIDKRLITLLDNRSHSMTITLWGDLAINEGEELWSLQGTTSKILITNLTASYWNRELCLGTTFGSTLLINPRLEQITNVEESDSDDDVNEVEPPIKVDPWSNAKSITVFNLTNTKKQDLKIRHCYFEARILKVLNLTKFWYEACFACNKKMTFTDNGKQCPSCTGINSKPRYMLRIKVKDDTTECIVTLFDAAEVIVKCSAEDIIKLDEFEQQTKLMDTVGDRHKFYIDISTLKESERTAKRVIAEAVEKKDSEKQELLKKIKEEK